MLGLYYSRAPFDNPYIEYLHARYPDSTHLAVSEAEAKRYLELSEYDVVLLDTHPGKKKSMDVTATLAAYTRQQSPASVVVIHRNNVFPLDALPMDLPVEHYDFTMTNKFGAIDLEETIQMLILRRLTFVSNGKKPHNLKGILCMRHPDIARLSTNYLRAAGLDILQSNDLDMIVRNLLTIQPDFIFMHCDINGADYDRVRNLAGYVREWLPQCLIIVGRDVEYMDRYNKIIPFEEHLYDHLMDPAPMPLEFLLLLLKEEEKKYKLDIVEDHQH
jgi:hypothetical protein